MTVGCQGLASGLLAYGEHDLALSDYLSADNVGVCCESILSNTLSAHHQFSIAVSRMFSLLLVFDVDSLLVCFQMHRIPR